MPTKLTYTGAEVQELLDKIEKGDFDNAKTLDGHPASYFAVASEFTSLAGSFATEQGRVDTLYSYFNNGSANDALSLGGRLPSYYATALQYEILQQTLTDFKSLFDSMFEKDSEGNIHAKLSLWSSGGITAGGVGSGGSGGGGISYNRLDSWSDYSADKAGYVLSALLGKDLDNRVSALANAGYVTQSALAPYALRSEIPSLVGYATQSWVGENYLSKNGGTVNGSITATSFIGNLTGTADNAANSLKLNGFSAGWKVGESTIPVIEASGVLELGFILDFHRADGLTGADFSTRLRCEASPGNTVLLPQANGTLALLSDIPTKLSQLTDDVVAGNYLSKNGGTINGSLTATSFIGNLTGNAGSATKLATPRTIWGQPFDGTGDITGALIGDIWRILKDQIHDGVFIQSKNYEGTSYLGNIFITAWNGNSLSSFNVWANKSIFGGNVAIGGTTTSEKLHIYGNTLISGGDNPYLAIEDNLDRQWYFQYYDNYISIGTSYSNGVKIDSAGNLLTAGSLTSQAIASAGISIGCDASGVASDNYAREINTFANKLYLQYRGGDLDLCGGGGTTYIGGALDGKTANFTSLTSPAITTNTLKVGNVTLVEENGALKVIGGFIATGGVTSGEKAS